MSATPDPVSVELRELLAKATPGPTRLSKRCCNSILAEVDGQTVAIGVAHSPADGEAWAAAVNALPHLLDTLAASQKRIGELERFVADLADEMEAELTARYAGMLPQLAQRHARDMATVNDARAALALFRKDRVV